MRLVCFNLIAISLMIYVFVSEYDGLLLDYSRQRATLDTIGKLFKLAEVGFVRCYYCIVEIVVL